MRYGRKLYSQAGMLRRAGRSSGGFLRCAAVSGRCVIIYLPPSTSFAIVANCILEVPS